MSKSDLQAILAEMKRISIDEKYNTRSGSKASLIGNGPPLSSYDPAPKGKGIKYLKASLRGYRPGAFVTALANAGERDVHLQLAGKAALEEFGVTWQEAPPYGAIAKATLGTTGATGGYVLPNNLVDTVIKPAVAEAIYSDLCTVREGVAVRGVDQPYRTGAPARMQFQNWGASKQNVDEAYGSYTATLGTLAKIYDVSKQYLRFSAGAAEQDVMDELAKSYRLAENYAVIAGPGTGALTPGVNDPTEGVYTALLAASATYTTVFSGPSDSTIAGNAAVGINKALSALASRARRASAIVMDPTTLFALFTQGNDTAGYFMSPLHAAGFTFTPDGALAYMGVPLLFDPQFDANTSTTKCAIAGDWKALRIFRGVEFRVDSSDVAGTRFDQNLVGFRGEAELGVNAAASVSVGAFQLVTQLIP